jgi:hypothetical protein
MLHFLTKILERQNDVLGVVQSMQTSMLGSRVQPQGPFAPTAPTGQLLSVSSSALHGQENDTWHWESSDSPPDSLKIPSSRITPDSILAWPIFENRYPVSYIQDGIFNSGCWKDRSSSNNISSSGGDVKNLRSQKKSLTTSLSFQEEEVVSLVDRFLSLVHTKNPILDDDTLRLYARNVEEDGLSWDGLSCLVVSRLKSPPVTVWLTVVNSCLRVPLAPLPHHLM